MVQCEVPGCMMRLSRGSRFKSKHEVKFYVVPGLRKNGPPYVQRRAGKRRALWLSKIGKMDKMDSDKLIRICSRHFISGKPADPSEETNPDWVPSLHISSDEAPNQMNNTVDIAEPECDTPVGSHPGDAECVEDPSNYVQIGLASESHSGGNTNVDSASESVDCADPLSISQDSNCDMNLDQECDVGVSTASDHANDSVVDDFALDQGIVNSTVSDEVDVRFVELQSEYNDVLKRYCKLRDQLTEAEVDKLELSHSLTESECLCLDYGSKNVALERENAELKLKVEQCEALLQQMNEQAECSKSRILSLENDLAKATKRIVTLEQLQIDDSLVSYYTGLPCYDVFDAVLTLVTSQASDPPCCLAPWECLLLTLMRLRLGLQLEDLAHRFGVSPTTAGSVFERWLFYLWLYLEPCINWPDRETLHKTMPESFKAEFGKSVAVIIDCFELFCERLCARDSRARTWSNYKHDNTVKFLIGITPLGAVSFISQGWGGRVSDKHITINSGLYEKLLPGDVILADRDFTISEDVGFYCARVSIPAFTRGQAQLSAHDVTDTRRLAALRVHVERVIGLVKNRFRILKTTLHHDFLSVKRGHKVAQIDEVVRVCCALANLSPGIV